MQRKDKQWQRVVQYIPMYMGCPQEPYHPYFVDDNDPVYDNQGWDIDGNTSGYYRVYSSFVEFKRHYPRAYFKDSGMIETGE